MRCHDVQQKLEHYSKNELAPSSGKEIETHLRRCDACRQELARLRRLEELLASVPVSPIPKGFAAKTVARAGRESPPLRRPAAVERGARERHWHRLRIVAGTAAALAGGLFLGGYLGFATWWSDGQAAAGAVDPLAGSGLQQLAEPGGGSLADAYMVLTTRGDR